MDAQHYAGYGFGIIITILLLAAIFSFSYNTEIENEYFQNYLELDSQLKTSL